MPKKFGRKVKASDNAPSSAESKTSNLSEANLGRMRQEKLKGPFKDFYKKMKTGSKKRGESRAQKRLRDWESDKNITGLKLKRLLAEGKLDEFQNEVKNDIKRKGDIAYSGGFDAGKEAAKRGMTEVPHIELPEPKEIIGNQSPEGISNAVIDELDRIQKIKFHEGFVEGLKGSQKPRIKLINREIKMREGKRPIKFAPWSWFRKEAQKQVSPIITEKKEYQEYEVNKGFSGESMNDLRNRILNYIKNNPEILGKAKLTKNWKGEIDKDVPAVVLGKKGAGYAYINANEVNVNYLPIGGITRENKSELPLLIRIDVAKSLLEGEAIDEATGAWHGKGVGRREKVGGPYYRVYEENLKADSHKEGMELAVYDGKLAEKKEETTKADEEATGGKTGVAKKEEVKKKKLAPRAPKIVKNMLEPQDMIKLALFIVLAVIVLSFLGWILSKF